MTEQDRQNLITSLNQLLADTAVYRHKAQAYHWNVTGLLFRQLHEEFEEIYDDLLRDDYDATAEQVRALGGDPTVGLSSYAEESVLEDVTFERSADNQSQAVEMIRELYEDNERILRVIQETEKIAEEASADGVLDFINGRHGTHNMIRYKLGSHLGGPTNPTQTNG